MEYSGRAENYNPEELKDFPPKMRKLPKTQKFLFASAVCGITSEEFDRAIKSMSKTDEGKQIARSIERCIKKVQDYTAKNYLTLSEIMERDIKKKGKRSEFWGS